jgi:isoleucyl-tRNA synthetase
MGEHVTLDAGTGAVHTAPAHGQEDFIVGQRYGLPVINPVGPDGRFAADTELVAGMKVNDANAVIINELATRGRLLHQSPLTHSYPHCWRHKTPVIFRATSQWFISMDNGACGRRCATSGRSDASETAAHHRHDQERPDWCVSRQRTGRADHAVYASR